MTPKQTKQDGEDTKLILYRISILEGGQKRIETKVDKLDVVKTADMTRLFDNFKESIVGSMNVMGRDLQRQIDDKASSQELRDFKKQMAGWGAVGLALFGATYSYFLTRLH